MQESEVLVPLQVHVATWNLGMCRLREQTFREHHDQFLQLLGGQNALESGRYDLHVVGFQEVNCTYITYDTFVRGTDEWTALVSEFLKGYGYVRVQYVRQKPTVIVLFSLRSHLTCIRDLESNWTRLDLLGWKGAVSIRFRLYGISICFVCSHLCAHPQNNERRIDEYRNILMTQLFKSEGTTHILYHDYVMWLGDLNFRLEEYAFTTDAIIDAVQRREYSKLLVSDQLTLARRDQKAFHELTEMPLNFPPTYKFYLDENRYDERRQPAWTDRILYRVTPGTSYEGLTEPLAMEQRGYGALWDPIFQCSDHRPVTSSLTLKVMTPKTAKDNGVDAYCPIISFVMVAPWYVKEDVVFQYTVENNGDRMLSQWDWIGLYHFDFTSLDDYLTYTWASQCRRTGVPKKGVIEDSNFYKPGKFVLLYISSRRSILGCSEPFLVRHRNSTLEVDEAEDALLWDDVAEEN